MTAPSTVTINLRSQNLGASGEAEVLVALFMEVPENLLRHLWCSFLAMGDQCAVFSVSTLPASLESFIVFQPCQTPPGSSLSPSQLLL